MKKIITVALSLIMMLMCAVPAFADAATLADNILEYNEIDDLIHTYNASVKQNDYKLHKFSGDEEGIEDKNTMLYSNNAAEKKLAKQAKTLMVNYYNALLDVEQAQINKNLLQTSLQIAQTKAAIGMGTQTDILSASESLLNSDKTLTSAQSTMTETKKTLQVMCGWAYESDAQLAPLPKPDMNRIALMNPAADLQTAIANNYTLKGNMRRLNNASEDRQIDNYQITAESNRQNIANSLNVAYANVIAARDAYNYAEAYRQLEETTLAQMNTKYAIGSVSKVELQTQTGTTRLAQIAAEKAGNNLLSAITNYEYELAGLAGAE